LASKVSGNLAERGFATCASTGTLHTDATSAASATGAVRRNAAPLTTDLFGIRTPSVVSGHTSGDTSAARALKQSIHGGVARARRMRSAARAGRRVGLSLKDVRRAGGDSRGHETAQYRARERQLNNNFCENCLRVRERHTQ
jgi:hypothetical protein